MPRRYLWFFFRNSNGGYKTQISPHVLCFHVYMVHYVFVFFPELALGKKRKGRPLAVYVYALLTIFHPGEMPTRRQDGFVDGGLNCKSPPCARNTKGEKTVKTSSSCVFGRKRRNGHVKDPRNAPRIRCCPPPACGPDPLCDTTSDTIVFVLLLLFNRNNGPDVWGEKGKKKKKI